MKTKQDIKKINLQDDLVHLIVRIKIYFRENNTPTSKEFDELTLLFKEYEKLNAKLLKIK